MLILHAIAGIQHGALPTLVPLSSLINLGVALSLRILMASAFGAPADEPAPPIGSKLCGRAIAKPKFM